MARWVEARELAGEPVPVADVAAAFQEAVVDVLTRKAVVACREHGVATLLIGGGVAANSRLRALAAEDARPLGSSCGRPGPGCAPTTARWWPRWEQQIVARGRQPSPLDLAADSSMPVTDVLLFDGPSGAGLSARSGDTGPMRLPVSVATVIALLAAGMLG